MSSRAGTGSRRSPLEGLHERGSTVSAAIAGLGITEMGKLYGRTASDFAGEALALALAAAGLEAGDVDGLLINGNQSAEMAPTLQFSLGLTDLTLVQRMRPSGPDAEGEEHGRLPRLPLGRGAAAPLRLLPGVQRRRRRDRHLGAAGARAAPAAGPPARLRPVRARRQRARRSRSGHPHGRHQ